MALGRLLYAGRSPSPKRGRRRNGVVEEVGPRYLQRPPRMVDSTLDLFYRHKEDDGVG